MGLDQGRQSVDLVPGRDCNECSECCITLMVDTPEFQKMPGRPCKHLCAGGGCSIYTTRFPVCRGWHCAWRYFDFLGEEWRPDRSGILLNFIEEEKLPPGYEMGLIFSVASQPSGDLDPSLGDFVARLITAGILVVVAVNGPPGHWPAQTHLNEAMKEAASAGDLGRIGVAFSEALALARAQPESFKPITHFRDTDASQAPRRQDPQERSWNNSVGGAVGAPARSVGSNGTPLTFNSVAGGAFVSMASTTPRSLK
jgi:hypothetical protein